MSVTLRTSVVPGALAWRHERTRAARSGASGLRLFTLPQLAARLAGGFLQPVQRATLHDLVADALAAGGFAELGDIATLPGTARAVVRTLGKAWRAAFDLQARATRHRRLADLALIERRVRDALPAGEKAPPDLVALALGRSRHARAILGPVAIIGHSDVAPCWQPLVAALAREVPLTWHRVPGPRDDLSWLGDRAQIIDAPSTPPPEGIRSCVVCADPRHEALEALRWARELVTSGRALPGEIAIAAASPRAWDDAMRTLADEASLPLFLVEGRPALSTYPGQQVAALTEVLCHGVSRERVLRVWRLCRADSALLQALPDNWPDALGGEASLMDLAAWQRAIDGANAKRLAASARSGLRVFIKLLAGGLEAAETVGDALLGGPALGLWHRALREGPAAGLVATLGALHFPDAGEPTSRILWGPAAEIATVARPFVRLVGLTSRAWPRAGGEDPLLPDHIVPARVLEPISRPERDRLVFARIFASTSRELVLSRSLRDLDGRRLAPSPLLPSGVPSQRLARMRIPAHAITEGDRLLARSEESARTSQVRDALACWRNWRSAALTPHDGLVRAKHPVIERVFAREHSASSLSILLRDPMGFVWRYAFGWRPLSLEELPLGLDPRTFGSLVHDLLEHAVVLLQRGSGLGNAHPHEREKAVRTARKKLAADWLVSQAIPPRLLWERALDEAESLANSALSHREKPLAGQRSWAEVAFGSFDGNSDHEVVASRGANDGPWGTEARVNLEELDLAIRGRIDRLDLDAKGHVARVTDYKTGQYKSAAKGWALDGGKELQRSLYALAVRSLLPRVREVETRLHYVRSDKGLIALSDAEKTTSKLLTYIKHVMRSLREGKMLPGPDTLGGDVALALPAYAGEIYGRQKREACLSAFAKLAPLWEEP